MSHESITVLVVPTQDEALHHWLSVKEIVDEHRDHVGVSGRIKLELSYLFGPYKGERRPTICSMGGEVCAFFEHADGYAKVTGGSMMVPSELRGLGIGTYLQNRTIRWITSHGLSPPVLRIFLSSVDAHTQHDANRRNRFYEQFGIRFPDLKEHHGVERAEGYSASDLRLSELKALSPGDSARLDSIRELDQEAAIQELGELIEQQRLEMKKVRESLDGKERALKFRANEVKRLEMLFRRLVVIVAVLVATIVVMVRVT